MSLCLSKVNFNQLLIFLWMEYENISNHRDFLHQSLSTIQSFCSSSRKVSPLACCRCRQDGWPFLRRRMLLTGRDERSVLQVWTSNGVTICFSGLSLSSHARRRCHQVRWDGLLLVCSYFGHSSLLLCIFGPSH